MVSTQVKHYITNDSGEEVSIKQAAEDFGVNYRTMFRSVVDRGCKTYEAVRLWRVKKAADKTYTTKYGEMTIAEIQAKHSHNVSRGTIRYRIKQRGAMCPSVWWGGMSPACFRKRLELEGLVESAYMPTIVSKFDRSKCPTKDGACEHRGECLNAVVFDNRRPDRCKEDRSCYEPRTIQVFNEGMQTHPFTEDNWGLI